jgi:hypothetical protein
LLFRHLPADSSPRLRVLIKFAENDYEKITALLSIRDEFIAKVARIDVELSSEAVDPEESVEERQQRWYLRKVEGGGFVVQLCAILLAWLAVEDDGMRKFIDEKVGLEDIRETIKGNFLLYDWDVLIVEQLKNVEDVHEDDENIQVDVANAREEKEIMEVLIDVLGDGTGQVPQNGIA